ncbi:unnamed protein product [Boreogadus saida]
MRQPVGLPHIGICPSSVWIPSLCLSRLAGSVFFLSSESRTVFLTDKLTLLLSVGQVKNHNNSRYLHLQINVCSSGERRRPCLLPARPDAKRGLASAPREARHQTGSGLCSPRGQTPNGVWPLLPARPDTKRGLASAPREARHQTGSGAEEELPSAPNPTVTHRDLAPPQDGEDGRRHGSESYTLYADGVCSYTLWQTGVVNPECVPLYSV